MGSCQFAIAYEHGERVNGGYNFPYGLGLWGEENVTWSNFHQGHSGDRHRYYENWVSGVESGSSPSGNATYTGVMGGRRRERQRDPAQHA